MTLVQIIILAAIVTIAAVVCFTIITGKTPEQKTEEPVDNEPPKPRVTPPTDRNVYTFSLDSMLEAEEWQMLFSAGWEFVTCYKEEYKDYAGCYPEAPGFTRTAWHYVFRRTGSNNVIKGLNTKSI